MPTIEELLITKPIKDPYNRALLSIMYTGSWLVSRITKLLKPYDISEPQYNVLRILRGQQGKPINMFAVQSRMLQRMSNVSRLVDKLVEKGLVQRTQTKENRRMVDLTITEKGLALLTELDPVIGDYMHNIARNLKKDEARTLSEWLDILRNE
ncbi:MAG TPA: MarR family transcriptional regulator [Flavipsychrobacter sp.]